MFVNYKVIQSPQANTVRVFYIIRPSHAAQCSTSGNFPFFLVSFPQITRKVIRKYFSPDGVEREEVTVEGSHQEMVSVEEGDGFSKVVKRTVVRSEGDQTEVSLSVCVSVCCLCVYRLCLGSIFQYF